MEPFKVAIVTVSDKGYAGEREDLSGPAIRECLPKKQYRVVDAVLVPDEKEQIEKVLCDLCGKADLILTTGGTGFAKRDVTPEATLSVGEKLVPGISEYMRMKSMEITDRGMLSRGVSVIRENTLIINLPGSPKAVKENLGFLLQALPHGLDTLLGRSAECGRKE